MKVTILLFICLVGCAFAALTPLAQCFDTECVKGGEICGYANPTNNASYIGCRGDSICTTSSSDTGICRERLKFGDYCGDFRNGCGDNMACDDAGEDNDICVATNPLATRRFFPGESCDYNVQCNYNSPFGSSSGDNENLCSGGKCKYVKTGDYCNGDYQCNYNNAYCGRKNICEKYIKEGGACFFDERSEYGCGKHSNPDRACVPNGQSGRAGTCRKLYSQKEGAFCRYSNQCQEGLSCYIGAPGSYGVCFKPMKTATLNQACPNMTREDSFLPNNNGCNATNLEFCRCTPQNGEYKCIADVNGKGAKESRRLNECMRKHYCSSSSFTCLKEHCKSEACSAYKSSRKNPRTYKDCEYEGLCNSAFTLVASPVLALLAFVVVLAL